MGLSLRKALRILGNQRKAAWKWWLEQSLNSLWHYKPSILPAIHPLEREGGVAVEEQTWHRPHSVIPLHYFLLHRRSSRTIRRMSLNQGNGGRIERRSVSPTIVASPFQDGAGIPRCPHWRSVGAVGGEPALQRLALIQPRMKHRRHMSSRLPVNEILLLALFSAQTRHFSQVLSNVWCPLTRCICLPYWKMWLEKLIKSPFCIHHSVESLQYVAVGFT